MNVSKLAFLKSATIEADEAIRSKNAVVVASGTPGLGRRTLLLAAASSAGARILEVNSKKLSKDHSQLKKQLKLIARECKLLQRAPLICNIDALVDDKDQARVDLVGSELVSEIDGPVFVTCGVQRPAMRWDRPCVVIDVKPPTSEQRAKLWRDSLGQGTEEDSQFLATQYPLAPALIVRAAEAAKTRANGGKLQPEDIYAGVRAVLDDKLGDYAKRVDVTQSWDDLVLPQDQLDAIKYLVARIRQRRTVYEQWGFAAKVGKGLGTSALFSGPPGTGKTMVAALIAKELGLELYQVDMAKVTSKWIGETERNLAALFDAAEAGHAILLFDECDSLFGKRTDVKSSNDRYANLETNYLLQRLESFTGICLLTTNHENAIDPAFMRRLSLHVRFELPEAAEREQLWRAMLPAAAPVAPSLDVAALARRFVMSGGYIRNAALRAAFVAADEGSAITTRHLECAAKLEYEGMGKIAA
ncbi:MAG TPA: AAA family ATPase [Gammaproteobacteria bacterium]|nr:AAA family ATPase [Gammaproteobacteria bacterium]